MSDTSPHTMEAFVPGVRLRLMVDEVTWNKMTRRVSSSEWIPNESCLCVVPQALRRALEFAGLEPCVDKCWPEACVLVQVLGHLQYSRYLL